jgi:hypothetical protein
VHGVKAATAPTPTVKKCNAEIFMFAESFSFSLYGLDGMQMMIHTQFILVYDLLDKNVRIH